MTTAGGETLPETTFRFDVVGGDGGEWKVVYLHASEKLSRVYEGTLLLAHALPAPDAASLMGKHVGVEVSRGAGGRNLRGLVRRVESMGSTGSYAFVKLTVVPELWTLSLRQNSRVWQHVPVATIVRDVLRDAGLYQGDGAFEVAPSVQAHPPREYCVQYKESDLAFVSRLLEEEGIPYAFKHEGEKEGFVLTGKDHAWPAVPTLDGSGKVPVLDAGAATHAVESAQWFNAVKQMKPAGAMLRDFDFTHPDAVLDMTKASVGEAAKHVVYEFPARFTLGNYDGLLKAYGKHAGEQWAKIRGEQLRADAETAAGRSNVTGLAPGMRLTLTGHEEGGNDGDQVVVGVEHHALAVGDFPDELWASDRFKSMLRTAGLPDEELSGPRPPRARYHNRFSSVASGVTWRPQREEQRPVISGPQTAMVMAQPGSDEEICVDEHGRVLVRFHWERPDQRGSAQAGKNASCWVRVAQSWAGVAWGAMFIPRVGMEVVVQFLDGDPDRPLITGCVYNGKNPPPYELPAHKTRSTFKSLSSPGGDGYNELRFEDLKGKEQVWVHAERDHDVMVKHDATMTVGNDRTHTVQHDEQLTVFNDRAASIRRNDSLEVEGYRSVAVHGGAGLSVQVDAKYRLNADAGILITCGSSSIEMLPDKVTVSSKTVNVVGASLVNINGKLVKINCDAAPTPAKSDTLNVMATKALSLVGTPGGVLDKVKGLIDPKKMAGGFAGKLGGLLKKLGIPERIMKRLQGLAEGVVGELLSALKEGRAPNWGRIGEQAIGTAVGIAVGEVFRPLERLGFVQGNKLLAGLVDEAKKTAETAATYGVLHAVGLNDGMAKDPFWQVLQEKHGEAWKGLMVDAAKEAGSAMLDALTGRRASEAAGGAAGGAAGAGVQRVATEAGVEAGMGQVVGGAAGATGGGGAAGGGGGALPNFDTSENRQSLATILMSETSVGNEQESLAVGWTVRNRMARNGTEDVSAVGGAYARNQHPTPAMEERAGRILRGEVPDPTGGATHFYSPRSMPREGQSTHGYDVGGGLEQVPGVNGRTYRPTWANTFEQTQVDGARPSHYAFYRAPGGGGVR